MTRAAAAGLSPAPVINPRSAPAWLRLADLASDDDRLSVLRRAADAGADSVIVYLRLAEELLDSDAEAALDACRRAGELEPTAAEPALCQGRAHLALGTPERAAPNLRRAQVLGRGTPTAEVAAELIEAIEAADPR